MRRDAVILEALGFLRECVGVLRQILVVGLQLGDHLRECAALAPTPERRGKSVTAHVFRLALHHQVGEAPLGVGIDGLVRQVRRVFIHRITGDEGPIGIGCVLVALLLHVQVAQARIQQPGIGGRRAGGQQPIEGLRTVEVGKRDAHHAQGIVGQFTIGARQAVPPAGSAALTIEQRAIEQFQEGLQAGLVLGLLEHGPAVLVQALLIEARPAGTARDHLLIGGLRLGVALGRKQQFTAPELHLGNLARARIVRDDAIECGECRIALPGGFIGPRELIQDLVVARVVRIGLQQD